MGTGTPVATNDTITAAKMNKKLETITDDPAYIADRDAAIAAYAAKCTANHYTGDGTTNKAIVHSAGLTPKLIMIVSNAGGQSARIIEPGYIHYVGKNTHRRLAVTQPNNTHFYVGNPSDYPRSGNASGIEYYWVVIG